MTDHEHLLEIARMAVERLERLPPDSIWARRSSGARGELLRLIHVAENHPMDAPQATDWAGEMQTSLAFCFFLLEKAARARIRKAGIPHAS